MAAVAFHVRPYTWCAGVIDRYKWYCAIVVTVAIIASALGNWIALRLHDSSWFYLLCQSYLIHNGHEYIMYN